MPDARTDPDLAAEFGRRVRAQRVRLGMTQEELAEVLGSHRTYPGSIERGELGPTLTTIVRLAGALGLDPGELVRGLSTNAAGTGRPRRRRSSSK